MKAQQPDNHKVSKIQDIAFKMFLENGYEATSVRSICKSAGIEQPTLYYFFDSKKGLFFSVLKRVWEKHEPQRKKDQTATKDLFLILYSLLRDRMMYTAANPDDIRFFIRVILFPPAALKSELEVVINKLEGQYRSMVQSIFESCKQQKMIVMNAAEASRVYWKFVNNTTMDIVFSDWRPTETELKELWDMFVKCRLKGEH